MPRVPKPIIPFCGAEFTSTDGKGRNNPYGIAAEFPAIICTKDPHPDTERHRNDELKFEWW